MKIIIFILIIPFIIADQKYKCSRIYCNYALNCSNENSTLNCTLFIDINSPYSFSGKCKYNTPTNITINNNINCLWNNGITWDCDLNYDNAKFFIELDIYSKNNSYIGLYIAVGVVSILILGLFFVVIYKIIISKRNDLF